MGRKLRAFLAIFSPPLSIICTMRALYGSLLAVVLFFGFKIVLFGMFFCWRSFPQFPSYVIQVGPGTRFVEYKTGIFSYSLYLVIIADGFCTSTLIFLFHYRLSAKCTPYMLHCSLLSYSSATRM